MDRFSPLAHAHIRVLVLPVGRIEDSYFTSFVSRLQNEASIIKLADLEPYTGEDDFVLSPKSFTQGSLFYNYTSAASSSQQEQLSPFELFREPLLVVGIIDGPTEPDGSNEQQLRKAVDILREQHPRVVHRQLLLLEKGQDEHGHTADDIIRVIRPAEAGDTSLREAVCKLSVRFLVELSTYTKAMQASPSIQTPGQTARSLQRTSSNRDREKQPVSGRSTPTQVAEASRFSDETGSKPPPLDHGTPATSFDQIPGANSVTSGSPRTESRTTNKSKHVRRASSQDHVHVQGFGSGTSQDKLKHRGKARVGIVTGSIFLMAGQWSEAMRILVENTNKARMLSDHIWHAKGLESIVVCLLLHIWAGMEFQIPSICYPIAERTGAARAQRFSVNLPSDFRPTDVAQQGSVQKLSTSLPDLLKLILSLYRSVEGSLELPFLCVSEAVVRFCKLLAALHNPGGELSHAAVNQFIRIRGSKSGESKVAVSSPVSGNASKTAIAEMLSHAFPSVEDSIPLPDHVALLTGISSVYALLDMHRKKANVLKDLVVRLTAALSQARKRGAAEMGIHPAASLSADTGAEAILNITEDSRGVSQMMSEIAGIYGVYLPVSLESESDEGSQSCFGSDNLKVNVLRELAAFCEASPDPYGVLRLDSAQLKSFGPNGAVDVTDKTSGILSKDEQIQLATTISRSIGVSKHLGIPRVEGTYWDCFLVRGVEFVPPELSKAVIDKSKLKSATIAVEQGTSAGNPLLYDPNANRPGTGAEVSKTSILVENEVSVCVVSLQNPYDFSVDVESLSLVTEGAELKISHQPIRLDPMRLQQVSLSVSPCSTGDCKITGCRVKMSGCIEQTLRIVTRPWSPTASTIIKAIGQEDRLSEPVDQVQQTDGPEYTTVLANVIGPLPSLALEDSSLVEREIMLLDGEEKQLSIVVKNISSIALSIFDIVTTDKAICLETDLDAYTSVAETGGDNPSRPQSALVEPGGSSTFKFLVTGKPKVSQVQMAFYYARQEQSEKYARVLTLPINMTVNAALQILHLDVTLSAEADNSDSCLLSFDVRNAWPRSLSYAASIASVANAADAVTRDGKQDGLLAPGEVQRLYLPMIRLPFELANDSDVQRIRKALSERLRVTWSGQGRVGSVDLSGVALIPEISNVVFQAPVDISLQLMSAQRTTKGASSGSRNLVNVGTFAMLRVKLVNRTPASELWFVHLRFKALHALDSMHNEQHISTAGALGRYVKTSAEGGEATVEYPICPLLVGSFELEITAKQAFVKNTNASPLMACSSMFIEVV